MYVGLLIYGIVRNREGRYMRIVRVLLSKNFKPEDSFKSKAMNPSKWLESAENLEAAIALVRPTLVECYRKFPSDDYFQAAKLIGPYYLLTGYALECLFKGIIICKGYQCVDAKRGIKFKGHNLVDLAKEAGIITGTYAEKYMLEELTRQTTWKGRYPTAIKWDKEYTNRDGKIEHHGITPFNVELVDGLYSKAKGVLIDFIKDKYTLKPETS